MALSHKKKHAGLKSSQWKSVAMQFTSSGKRVVHALHYQVPHRRIISVLDIEQFMTMAVDVLASIVFGLMALSNLQVSIHTWVFLNICPLSFLHHSTNITSSSPPNFFILLRWLYVTLWYVILIHYAAYMYVVRNTCSTLKRLLRGTLQ